MKINSLQRSGVTADTVQNLTILAIFAVLLVVGFILEPMLFFSKSNITNIFVSASSIIMVAAPVTLVLISGNLDLSVGGVGAMSAVLFGLMASKGVNIGLAAAIAIAAGASCGFASGISISALKLPSFIISLAFKYIGRGIALIGASGAIVMGIPKQVENIASGQLIGLPLPMVYALITTAVFIWIQTKTVFAAKCYATGSNPTVATLSGISNKQTITGVFTMSGLMAGIVGIVLVSRYLAADSGFLPTLESDCIIAAVLGGTDINGGRGTVLGMLIGALFITVLTNIMNMLGMTIYIQNLVKGIVLIGAIYLNYVIRTRVRV